MSRITVRLSIEEADLKLFQNSEGVALPTNVVKLKFVGGVDTYVFQHATNEDAASHAVPYSKSPDGIYPPIEHGRSSW